MSVSAYGTTTYNKIYWLLKTWYTAKGLAVKLWTRPVKISRHNYLPTTYNTYIRWIDRATIYILAPHHSRLIWHYVTSAVELASLKIMNHSII